MLYILILQSHFHLVKRNLDSLRIKCIFDCFLYLPFCLPVVLCRNHTADTHLDAAVPEGIHEHIDFLRLIIILVLLSNLMQNAVKYNVEGGSVWVRLETDDRHLYLSVKDTGIGIPPEMKARVFERFFRVDKGRSRNVGGTGLGLAIVKHLANLYTGSVQLDSELGKGSLFRVTLIYPKEGKK